MLGNVKRRGKVGVAVALAAGFLLGGATYGAVVVAGASGTSTTYYVCLTTTKKLTEVGTVSPTTCPTGAQVISWNAVGPQGPTGPQGPAGLSSAQYTSDNAWCRVLQPPASRFPSLRASS